MKTCNDCQKEIATGLVCDGCGAVLEILAVVKRHWGLDELEKLRDVLRAEGVRDALERALANGASVKAKLLSHIVAAGARIGCGPDVMRSKVCDGINAEIRSAKQAEAFDGKNGEGAYSRYCASWLGENVAAALGAVKAPKEREVAR